MTYNVIFPLTLLADTGEYSTRDWVNWILQCI